MQDYIATITRKRGCRSETLLAYIKLTVRNDLARHPEIYSLKFGTTKVKARCGVAAEKQALAEKKTTEVQACCFQNLTTRFHSYSIDYC